MCRLALTGAVLLVAQVMVQAQTTSTARVLPQDWLPALAPSIDTILSELQEANTQAEMNSLSRHIADMRDAQLFIAYVRLYEQLSTKERVKLQQEQTEWLKKRTKAAKGAVQSKGGSLAPLEANDAETTLTEQRLVELRARYKAALKKSEP